MVRKSAPKPESRYEAPFFLLIGGFLKAPKPEISETPFLGKEEFLKNLVAAQQDADMHRNFERIRGIACCAFCDHCSGLGEYDHMGWKWSNKLQHAVEAHNVVPSDDFISFVSTFSEAKGNK